MRKKKMELLMILALLVVTVGCSAQNEIKRYNVKSGKITYAIELKGSVMGSCATGSGYEIRIFRDWGAQEAVEEKYDQKMEINILGAKQTDIQKTHNKIILDKNISYSIDYIAKEISKQHDLVLESITEGHSKQSVEQLGEKMLKALGGEKVGKENVCGYECDIWKIAMGKQWIHKGIPLRIEVKTMGITMIRVATEVDFGCFVGNSAFELPDYPIIARNNISDDTVF